MPVSFIKQFANVLIEGLIHVTFYSIVGKLGINHIHSPTWGECQNPLINVAENISLYNFNYIIRKCTKKKYTRDDNDPQNLYVSIVTFLK